MSADKNNLNTVNNYAVDLTHNKFKDLQTTYKKSISSLDSPDADVFPGPEAFSIRFSVGYLCRLVY